MKNKIKNVIVINDFDYIQGGASKVAIDTARILKDNGINVVFFSAVTDGKEKNDGINYVCTNQKEALKDKILPRGMINGLYNIKARKCLKKLLEEYSNEDTVIHVHGWTKALSSSVFSIAHKKKFKIFLTTHDYFSVCPNGGYYNYKKNVICKYKGNSLKCICENCDSRNYLFKMYRILRLFIQNKIVRITKKVDCAIGISDLNIEVLKDDFKKICKVRNPIDIGDMVKQENISNNEYFLFLGRVTKEKGIDVFCKAITELNFKGVVVGDGSELERLKKDYPNIEFVGWKNGNEVKEYISKARALVFPSVWYEGAPLTPLEVMSKGIPCAISNKCSAKEYIENENGVIFDTDNIEDVKEKILYMNDRLEQMGEQSYNYIKEIIKYDYSEELLKVYNQVGE